jgi:hypothetical protein
MIRAERHARQQNLQTSAAWFEDWSLCMGSLEHRYLMTQGDVFSLHAAWPRRPERRELSVIKIRSSMPPAAYQRLDANPTIHMQMRFLGSTHGQLFLFSLSLAFFLWHR